MAPRVALLAVPRGELERFSCTRIDELKTVPWKGDWRPCLGFEDSKKRGGGGFVLERVENRTLDSFGHPFGRVS